MKTLLIIVFLSLGFAGYTQQEIAVFKNKELKILTELDTTRESLITISEGDYIMEAVVNHVSGSMFVCNDNDITGEIEATDGTYNEVTFFFIKTKKKGIWKVLIKFGKILEEHLMKKTILI